ncbi:mechanosensitive ion channel domain-containing protein [uncultured Paracoccus sp.]|uniref:mechanosensitive ion channel family protein n=1 Tax=uncultured Paracoccus sp. TaxID=189685 RepID=UPI0026365AE7|nr:mechanosensitive ion channel domain-containing protein [uncultured Paracoccus sp.]
MTTTKDLLKYIDTSTPLGALVLAAILFGLGLILSWSVRRLLRTALSHDRSEKINEIALSFLSQLSILAVWLILLTVYAHLVPVLNRLGTALLAGVSLMSVVVGFAAQTTLGNLVAGISLVLYQPFRRGDRLQIAAPTPNECEVGVVEDMSLGFTVLRTDDGRKIIVANGTMAQNTMIKLEDGAAPKG